MILKLRKKETGKRQDPTPPLSLTSLIGRGRNILPRSARPSGEEWEFSLHHVDRTKDKHSAPMFASCEATWEKHSHFNTE